MGISESVLIVGGIEYVRIKESKRRKMRKQILVMLGITLLILVALFGSACQRSTPQTPTPPKYTMEESEKIARNFVLKSPTYRFDGIEGTLKLVHIETLRCPWCWEFTYQFQSRHAGYGDRTGQMLAQVITTHEVKIVVQEYKVTRGVMDGCWDMLKQCFITR